MKLLFDENISRSLVASLADLFPNSDHVVLAGLIRNPDQAVWEHARQREMVIASKDADFVALSSRRGHPPKVIHLAIGNCPTAEVEQALRLHYAKIMDFGEDPKAPLLSLE